jgi:hypothetical protein
MERRTFLLASGASQTRVFGANDRIRAGIDKSFDAVIVAAEKGFTG